MEIFSGNFTMVTHLAERTRRISRRETGSDQSLATSVSTTASGGQAKRTGA